MALHEMMTAHNVMVEARKKPAVWLVSPPALQKLRAETKQTSETLAFLPIRVVEQWSFGWMLLDEHRARAMGITDLE